MLTEDELRTIIAAGTAAQDQVTMRGKQTVNHRLVVEIGGLFYAVWYQVQEGATIVFEPGGPHFTATESTPPYETMKPVEPESGGP